MAHPVVHFEIVSPDAPKLRDFYTKAFDWNFAASTPAPGDGIGDYSTVQPTPTSISGGIGRTANGYTGHVTFYVYSDDVEASLKKIESLGGKRIMNPSKVPNMPIEIALFEDPSGNTVGLVNPGEM